MTDHYVRNWGERKGARRRKQKAPLTAAQAARSSYYGIPPIHKPHWNWMIVAYFFLGGLSGASYVIASIAELSGAKKYADIVRTGRLLSFVALLPCPALLILDLKRPERFLHMLRVVKLRSPMSVGTWGLFLFSVLSTLSAATQATRDGMLAQVPGSKVLRRMPNRAIGAIGIVPGFFLSGYTGVLLGATAVPLWAKNALLLGPLFVASALSSASSAISLVLAIRGRTQPEAMHGLESVERMAKAAEAGLMVASVARLGVTAKPLAEGRTGKVMAVGAIGAGIVVPTVLQAANRRHARGIVVLASVLTLVGGYAIRHAVVHGGKASADDPHATFDLTRKS